MSVWLGHRGDPLTSPAKPQRIYLVTAKAAPLRQAPTDLIGASFVAVL